LNNDLYPEILSGLDGGGLNLWWNESATFIEEVGGASKIKVYPNPDKDIICIEPISNSCIIEGVFIYDLQGKEIFNIEGFENKIHLETIARGMYILKIKTSEGELTSKFIKD